MDIQKKITEAIEKDEEKAFWFIRKLIHDEVRRQIKSHNAPEFTGVMPKLYSKFEYEELLDKFTYASKTMNLIKDALIPKPRDEGWVDDYDSLLAVVRGAIDIIDEWKAQERQ